MLLEVADQGELDHLGNGHLGAVEDHCDAIDLFVVETPEQASHLRAGRPQQLKRLCLADRGVVAGVPLHLVAAGANRPDGTLPGPTVAGLAKLGPPPPGATVRLDRGYDSAPTRALLAGLGFGARISRTGDPVHAGPRRAVERTHAWLNGYGRLRRCTERRAAVAAFCLFLAAAFVVTRLLVDKVRPRYRWPTRPTTRRPR